MEAYGKEHKDDPYEDWKRGYGRSTIDHPMETRVVLAVQDPLNYHCNAQGKGSSAADDEEGEDS